MVDGGTAAEVLDMQMQGFGHVAPWEEAKAKALIDEEFMKLTGKPFTYKTCGYFVCLKIYIRPEELKTGQRADGSSYTIYMPQTSQTDDKYQSIAALVVGVGPQAYKGQYPDGTPKFPEGPWCRIGDWVTIPRNEAHLFVFRGVALGQINDDRVMGVIEDPTDVMAIHMSDSY